MLHVGCLHSTEFRFATQIGFQNIKPSELVYNYDNLVISILAKLDQKMKLYLIPKNNYRSDVNNKPQQIVYFNVIVRLN